MATITLPATTRDYPVDATDTSCLLERNQAIAEMSTWAIIQRIALGALTCLLSFPLLLLIEYEIVNLMQWIGITPTAQQDIFGIWEGCDHFSAGIAIVLKTALLSLIVLIGPILEEFLFRSLLQEWQESCQDHPIHRILLNGLLFGIFHLSSAQGWTNLPIFLITFLMGCIYAALRETTGDIISSSTAHIAHNATGMAQFLLPV